MSLNIQFYLRDNDTPVEIIDDRSGTAQSISDALTKVFKATTIQKVVCKNSIVLIRPSDIKAIKINSDEDLETEPVKKRVPVSKPKPPPPPPKQVKVEDSKPIVEEVDTSLDDEVEPDTPIQTNDSQPATLRETLVTNNDSRFSGKTVLSIEEAKRRVREGATEDTSIPLHYENVVTDAAIS